MNGPECSECAAEWIMSAPTSDQTTLCGRRLGQFSCRDRADTAKLVHDAILPRGS